MHEKIALAGFGDSALAGIPALGGIPALACRR